LCTVEAFQGRRGCTGQASCSSNDSMKATMKEQFMLRCSSTSCKKVGMSLRRFGSFITASSSVVSSFANHTTPKLPCVRYLSICEVNSTPPGGANSNSVTPVLIIHGSCGTNQAHEHKSRRHGKRNRRAGKPALPLSSNSKPGKCMCSQSTRNARVRGDRDRHGSLHKCRAQQRRGRVVRSHTPCTCVRTVTPPSVRTPRSVPPRFLSCQS
jgi:hypothetical protein